MERNVLQGDNVFLRAAEPTDIDFIYQMENDTRIWHFGNILMPYSRYQIEQYVLNTQHDIYSEKQIRLMIEKNRPDNQYTIAGAIDLFDYDAQHQRAGIGILIISNERNKGYASEALNLLIEYCFKVLELHQVFCNITADNPASIQLFEKAGFVRCGEKKDWRFHQNRWTDEYTYQLIRQ